MTTPAAPAQTGTSAAQKPATDAGTEYVILQKDAAGWIEVTATVTARDRGHAIRLHCEKANATGTFQAVTAKQWKPVKVTAETVTTLKLEDAK